MRVVRIFGALLLLLFACGVGGVALLETHLHEWGDFNPALLFTKSLLWTLGCPVFAALAIAVARGAGEPTGVGDAVGTLSCFGALGLWLHAAVVGNHHPEQALPFAIAGFVLSIVTVIAFAGRKKSALKAAASPAGASAS